jgi:hypothetical protein
MGRSLHRGTIGENGGVRLLGHLRENESEYLGSFSWSQKILNIKAGGPAGTLARKRAALS